MTIAVWLVATAIVWRGNRRLWDLGPSDVVTVSLFILIGATFIALALGGSPPVIDKEGLS